MKSLTIIKTTLAAYAGKVQQKPLLFAVVSAAVMVSAVTLGVVAASSHHSTRKPSEHTLAAHSLASSTPSATASPSPSPTSTPSHSAAPATPTAKVAAAAVHVASFTPVTPMGLPGSGGGQPSPSPQAQAVEDWFNQYGGFMQSLANDFNALANADPNDPAAVIQACQSINTDATTGLHQPPLPNAQIQQDLVASMTDFQAGGLDCSNAVSTGNAQLAQQSGDEFTQGANMLTSMESDIAKL